MTSCRLKILATAAVFAGAVGLGLGTAPGVSFATDPVPGEFEIDIGEDFAFPADPVANIASDGCSMGVPDWDDIFTDSGGADPQGLDARDRGGLRDDTDELCFGPGNGTPDFEDVWGGLAATFVNDQTALKGFVDDTIFAESNKNNDLIATWNWDTGNVPPKDDVFNAYVYATSSVPTDDLMFYAGIERVARTGASHLDVEFNQAAIGLDKDPECGDDQTLPSDDPLVVDPLDDDPPCEFTGEKTVGDVLVVMDFEQGGALGMVELRVWDGTQYGLVVDLLGEGCVDADGTSGNTGVCAHNNSTGIATGDWLTIDKSTSSITTLEQNAFTEIGINITQVLAEFGAVAGCFSTVQVKSRSSPSFNSELKDFALAKFGICSIEVTKECTAAPNTAGTAIDVSSTGVVTNTGALELFNCRVTDDLGTDDGGVDDITVDTVEPALSPDEDGTYLIEYTIDSGFPFTAFDNNVLAECSRGNTTVTATATDTCAATILTDIDVTKVCTAVLNADGENVDITVSGNVTNPSGTSDEVLDNVTVVDDRGTVGTGDDVTVLTLASLALGASAPYSDSFQTMDIDCVGTLCTHTDNATASGTGRLTGTLVTETTNPGASCDVTIVPDIQVTKECVATINTAGTAIDVSYTGTVQNIGAETLLNVLVEDRAPPVTGTIHSQDFNIGTLLKNASANFGASFTTTNTSFDNRADASGTGKLSGVQATDDFTDACEPTIINSITILKECFDATAGNPLDVSITVTNTGDSQLTGVSVNEDNGSPGIPGDDFAVNFGTLAPGESKIINTSIDPPFNGLITNTATITAAVATLGANPDLSAAFSSDTCSRPGEGCTPGYWKQPQHFDSWVPTGLAPTDTFFATFGRDRFPGATLLDVLEFGGSGPDGRAQTFARACVATYIAALHPGVAGENPTTILDLIVDTIDDGSNAAFMAAKNLCRDSNQLGCPLN